MSGFTQAQSAMLGAAVARLVSWTGGSSENVGGLRVCRVGRVRLYAKGGTQWGDSFVTGRRDLTDGLIAHETHHRDAQWRRYGWWFGVMYLSAQITDVWWGGRPYNRYELDAEIASDFGGGYPRPDETG